MKHRHDDSLPPISLSHSHGGCYSTYFLQIFMMKTKVGKANSLPPNVCEFGKMQLECYGLSNYLLKKETIQIVLLFFVFCFSYYFSFPRLPFILLRSYFVMSSREYLPCHINFHAIMLHAASTLMHITDTKLESNQRPCQPQNRRPITSAYFSSPNARINMQGKPILKINVNNKTLVLQQNNHRLMLRLHLPSKLLEPLRCITIIVVSQGFCCLTNLTTTTLGCATVVVVRLRYDNNSLKSQI